MEEHPPASNAATKRLGVLASVVVLAVLAFSGIALLYNPTYYTPARKQGLCANKLKAISLALHEYHRDHGSFPPAFVVDESGRRIHSWRGLLFPYIARIMGKNQSADRYRYRLDEPWNGPNNSKLQAEIAGWCECPSYRDEHPNAPFCCNYVAVVDPTGAFRGTEPTKFSFNSRSNTIVVVDTHDNPPQWFEPRDITLEEMIEQFQSRPIHGNKTYAARVDGSARPIEASIDEPTLRTLVDREVE